MHDGLTHTPFRVVMSINCAQYFRGGRRGSVTIDCQTLTSTKLTSISPPCRYPFISTQHIPTSFSYDIWFHIIINMNRTTILTYYILNEYTERNTGLVWDVLIHVTEEIGI